MNNMLLPLGRPGENPVALYTGGDTGFDQRGLEGAGVPILTRYWRVIRRRIWVIVGTVVFALALGLVVTLLMTPQYTATSTVEISRDDQSMIKLPGGEEAGAVDQEFYQTQYGLLESKAVAERVVRELRLADDREFFAMYGAKDAEESLAGGEGQSRQGADARTARARTATDILLRNVAITPERLSRLVGIAFTSPNPAFSAKVANAWPEVFIRYNLERRVETTAYAREFLETQLQNLRRRLEDSERKLVAYAAQQRIVNVGSDSDDPTQRIDRPLVAENLSRLSGELARATAARIEAASNYQQSRRSGAASPEGLAYGAISTLRQRRAELSAEYQKLLTQYEPGFPAARALANQLAELDASIVREENRVRGSSETEYRRALAQENELRSKVQGLEADLLDLRRRSIQYNIYQRDADTNRTLYDGLLQQYKEIGVAGSVGVNNVAVVDRARVPVNPSKPKPILNMLLALIVGLAAGVGIALALDRVDESLRDPQDVESKLRLPFLGVVPMAKEVKPQDALADRNSPLSEAYLSVATSLELATEHGVPKSLVVTSTRPKEGKSTSAFSIAVSLVRLKHRVLLIDGDMRSPSLHRMLGIRNETGLSSILSRKATLREAIAHSEAFPGLSFVVAGQQPPNAAELIAAQSLEETIAEALTLFDHVVIDGPPVIGLADAPLLASKVEGVLFVIEANGVRARIVRAAISRLWSQKVRLVGGILTKFNPKNAHLSYDYDYTYRYGEPAARLT